MPNHIFVNDHIPLKLQSKTKRTECICQKPRKPGCSSHDNCNSHSVMGKISKDPSLITNEALLPKKADTKDSTDPPNLSAQTFRLRTINANSGQT